MIYITASNSGIKKNSLQHHGVKEITASNIRCKKQHLPGIKEKHPPIPDIKRKKASYTGY